jgi:hypothetical protein
MIFTFTFLATVVLLPAFILFTLLRHTMWAAIRSDLQEFVSGVADETDQVLQTTPLKKDDALDVPPNWQDWLPQAQEEVEQRCVDPDTYTEPLDESSAEVQTFLDQFDIETKTDEIAQLLQEKKDLQALFEELVPTEISYPLFWQRYFYRCTDLERVAKELSAQPPSVKKSGFGSLLGGALQAVSQTLDKADHVADDVPGSGMNIFGSSGRPPFVMNTAVDEDEDNEEEEELGWDDDEEEEEEEEDAADESEEITFSGGNNNQELDKLAEQLAQALSEKDALHDTIKMLKEQLAAIKSGKEVTNTEKDMEKLKVKLFEKDAELAALKATLQDTHEDDDESKKQNLLQLHELQQQLTVSQKELQECKDELTEAQSQLQEAQQEALQTREAATSAQNVMQQSLDMARSEADALRHALESTSSSNEEELSKSEQSLKRANNKVAELMTKIKELELELETTKQRNVDLEAQLKAKAHTEPPAMMEEATLVEAPVSQHAVLEERASPSSESTSVKVETHHAPQIPANDDGGREDAEDDWGDDW